MIYFKIKSILLVLLFNIFSVILYSQNLVFNNIRSINLTNQSVIKNDDGIQGYFFIHEKDTIDDSANTYLLSITDKKLNIVNETKIKVSQESYILETSDNGSEIVLSFLDFKTKTFEYQIYDLNGMKKFAYNRKISRKDFKQYAKSILKERDEDDFKSFYPVDDVGFIYKSMQTGKDLNSVKVDFYATKENKEWTYEPIIKASYFFWDYLGYCKDVVYIYIYTFKSSVYLDKPEVFIVGLDVKTGKELFKKPAGSKYKIVAKGIKTLNDGERYLFGTYYNQSANLAKDKADGLALWKISAEGNIIDEKYTSWENSLGKFLTIKNNGKISGTGNLYVHDIIQSANGNIYFLGEGHTKVVNAFAVAYGAIFGVIQAAYTVGYLKEVATDMVMVKLDSAFDTKEGFLFDKKNSKSFGYNNTYKDKTYNSFSFWYLSNRENVVNAINIKDDKVTTDKIRINFKTSRSLVLSAPNQQILLLEFYKTAKKLEINFKEGLIE